MDISSEYLNDENIKKRERAKLWRASIGLQAVDNLCVSNFLIETTRKHIEGLLSIDEHYAQKRKHQNKIEYSPIIVLSLFSYSKISNN